MTHQAPSTMQAWPTSMNVFLTTTFSVPFAQFGDIMRHQWRKPMLHQVSLVFMNELHHKHILKRKGLYSTPWCECCKAGSFFWCWNLMNFAHLPPKRSQSSLCMIPTLWTFIQWQLQHGTRHGLGWLPLRCYPTALSVFTAVVSPPSKNDGAETRCGEWWRG